MSVSPTVLKSPTTNEQGKEATRLKALVMEVEREYKAAEKVAELFHSVLPAREVLIDNEDYWHTETEVWKVWRDGVEKEWVEEGELRANLYTAAAKRGRSGGCKGEEMVKENKE